MKGIFVIGTDTGVGKTVASAGLLKIAQRLGKAAYWKPVQTGVIRGDDTAEVKALSGLEPSCFVEPAFRFPEPLSPYKAAEKWGKKIELEALLKILKSETDQGKFMIVEGAGGVLVPYDRTWLQINLIKQSGLPVILVGKDKVGVINQVLLTVRALKEADIPFLGTIITQSTCTSGNSDVIKEFSDTEVLLELLPKEDKRILVAEVERSERLRKVMRIASPTV